MPFKFAVGLTALLGTLVVTASCKAGGSVDELPATTVSAERQADGTYRVVWQDHSDAPADLYLADMADAPKGTWRKVAAGTTADQARVKVAEGHRPYFALKPAVGQTVWVSDRALPLQGGRNFRDLGGYRSADGRTVRWGLIYRSGSMSKLTAADQTYLQRLGIRTVCDFRTKDERQQDPNAWAQATKLNYWSRDYAMSGADLESLFQGKVGEKEVREKMADLYRTLPFEQAPAYRAMFAQLLADKAPLAFNCTAGKDRAGLAAALVLTALGVPFETVSKDYQLTNTYLPESLAADPHFKSAVSALPKTTVDALMAADPAYLAAAFDEIKRRYGSVDAYFAKELKLGDSERTKLKTRYLEGAV